MAADNNQTSKDNPQSKGDDRQTAVAVIVPQVRPVIYDLGSRKKKYIKRLKNGRGELMAEVGIAVEQYRATLPEDERDKNILPVIFIYKKKKGKGKKASASFSMNPFTFPFNLIR
ncbi:MAG: hypothetical protein JOZ02_20685 [Acidobacteria bacterium]|nr:hypothetical protein [Acidobacteriota bacterium]